MPHLLDAFGVSILGAYGASQLDNSGVSARRLDAVCPSTSLKCPPKQIFLATHQSFTDAV